MSAIKEILASTRKTNEIVELLDSTLARDRTLTAEIIQCCEDGTTAEKGE